MKNVLIHLMQTIFSGKREYFTRYFDPQVLGLTLKQKKAYTIYDLRTNLVYGSECT